MPLARTVNVKSQLVTWFTTVLIPEVQPDLRNAYAKRGPISLPKLPHRTPYLEDAAGALERVIPSGDWDWTEKYGDDALDVTNVWSEEPTFDAEGNQLTPGVPATGEWITEPTYDSNGKIVEPGDPNPEGDVVEYNWRQFWRGSGFTIPPDFPTTPITDGCPDPATGEFVNSIRLHTRTEPDGTFTNMVTMRVRYTIDDPDGAPGNREWEQWDEFTYRDVTTDRGQTWDNSSSDTVWNDGVYVGPTLRPEGP